MIPERKVHVPFVYVVGRIEWVPVTLPPILPGADPIQTDSVHVSLPDVVPDPRGNGTRLIPNVTYNPVSEAVIYCIVSAPWAPEVDRYVAKIMR